MGIVVKKYVLDNANTNGIDRTVHSDFDYHSCSPPYSKATVKSIRNFITFPNA